MTLALNAPDVTCPYCRGEGAHARALTLLVGGIPSAHPAYVLLHCRCLNSKLKELHELLDGDATLKDWPWDELAGTTIPKAQNGPEPAQVGSPFPVEIAHVETPAPVYKPKVIEPAPSVPNPKKTKKKKG